MNIKTASDLKYAYENANPNGHFFDRETMAFFGDRMSNFGVRKVRVRTNWHKDGKYDGNSHQETPIEIEAIELYRRKPVKCGLGKPHYFTPEGKELCGVEVVG